jgi:predicted kinase
MTSDTRPSLYLPVGPPACGKSTFVERLVEGSWLPQLAIVSPDVLREMLTGDHSNQDANDQVFDMVNTIVESRLKWQQDVWVDATNLHVGHRNDLAHRATRAGARVITVWFLADADEVRRRNATRSQPVPDSAMEKMLEAYGATRFEDLPGLVLSPDALVELVSVS